MEENRLFLTQNLSNKNIYKHIYNIYTNKVNDIFPIIWGVK